MNDDLKRFEKKKCSFCGNYFYELGLELPKYNISLCKICNSKSKNPSLFQDKATDLFLKILKYGRININTKNKKY